MSDGQDATTAAAGTTETVLEKSLLDTIVEEGRLGRDAESRSRGKDMVKQFVSQFLEGTMTLSADSEAMINKRIAQIDAVISEQLNEVLHNPAFQKLEGTWRGLQYLLKSSETSENLKIKVFNCSKADLLKDLQRASEFDQSAMFKKVYEEEFGVFGGHPFGCLIGDYDFGKTNQDMELLEKISQVASAAHAPFIAGTNAEMFNLDSFSELNAPRDLAKVFDTTEYAKWKSFRNSDDSRYVALAMPHILMRDPYGKNTRPVEEFAYEEAVDGTDHSKYLWGNAAWALAARITDSFAKYNWCATIRGVEGGGKVEGLTVHNFKTEEGDIAMKCPTEVQIPDRREKELADLGFVPLVHCKNTDYAAFFSVQSAQKPKTFDTDAANANARLSSNLSYILAVSRFGHYLKAMMRDKIGSYMSRMECEVFLNRWISGYVIDTNSASAAMKARHPLAEARVDVVEMPGKPGAYRAVAFLKPHFQLDELTVSMRLVADLPQPAGG
jgi:type VI secretion system protein ImpC